MIKLPFLRNLVVPLTVALCGTALQAQTLSADIDADLLDPAAAQALFPYPEGLIDANSDLIKWRWQVGDGYTYENNSELAADDWLVSHPINLEKGKTYILAVTARCSHARYPERLEVLMGPDIDATAMTTGIIAPTTIDWTQSHDISGTITPAKTEALRIGLHAISEADMAFLHVSHLSLKVDTSAPGIGPDCQNTITRQGNTLTISAPSLPATVYDATGRTILTISTPGRHTLTLPRGLYIVRGHGTTLRFAL